MQHPLTARELEALVITYPTCTVVSHVFEHLNSSCDLIILFVILMIDYVRYSRLFFFHNCNPILRGALPFGGKEIIFELYLYAAM